jgi:hypothetical protein
VLHLTDLIDLVELNRPTNLVDLAVPVDPSELDCLIELVDLAELTEPTWLIEPTQPTLLRQLGP